VKAPAGIHTMSRSAGTRPGMAATVCLVIFADWSVR
jgi:hypothetical protein